MREEFEELRKIISEWCFTHDDRNGSLDNYDGEPEDYMAWKYIKALIENILAED